MRLVSYKKKERNSFLNMYEQSSDILTLDWELWGGGDSDLNF